MNMLKKVLLAVLVMAPAGLMGVESVPSGEVSVFQQVNIVEEIVTIIRKDIESSCVDAEFRQKIKQDITNIMSEVRSDSNPAKKFLEKMMDTSVYYDTGSSVFALPLHSGNGCLKDSIALVERLLSAAVGATVSWEGTISRDLLTWETMYLFCIEARVRIVEFGDYSAEDV